MLPLIRPVSRTNSMLVEPDQLDPTAPLGESTQTRSGVPKLAAPDSGAVPGALNPSGGSTGSGTTQQKPDEGQDPESAPASAGQWNFLPGGITTRTGSWDADGQRPPSEVFASLPKFNPQRNPQTATAGGGGAAAGGGGGGAESAPGAGLIGSTIAPIASQRLTERQGLADGQMRKISGLDRSALIQEALERLRSGANLSDRAKTFRGYTDNAAAGLQELPDRYSQARTKWDLFANETQPVYDRARKDATNDAAANGYVGSGRLTTAYGDLALNRERDLDITKTRYLNDALEKEQDDYIKRLLAFRGLEGQEFDQYNTDRNFEVDNVDGNIGFEFDRAGYFNDMEGTQANRELSERTEQRGERDYQRRLAEQALADWMERRRLENDETQAEFERNEARRKAGLVGA